MIADTSKKAYKEDVVPSIGHRQEQVMHALHEIGEATNTEIADHLGWSINRLTPRVNELRKKSRVFEAGKRDCKITGRLCHTWSTKPQSPQLPFEKMVNIKIDEEMLKIRPMSIGFGGEKGEEINPADPDEAYMIKVDQDRDAIELHNGI